MIISEFEDEFGNPLFNIEVNLEVLERRTKGLEDILKSIRKSIEGLKELKQKVSEEGVI